MKRTTQAFVSAIAALAAMALSGGAAAQQTWNYGDQAGNCNVPGNCTPTGTGPTATAAATGYGMTGSTWVGGSVTNQNGSGLGFTSALTPTPPTGSSWETTTSPDHAFDNRAGTSGSTNYGTATTEMLLINFSSKVNLTALALGWFQTDSDVSVLRWDGATTSPVSGSALVNKSGVATSGTDGLTATGGGWTLVSSLDVDAAVPSMTFKFTDGVGYATASDNKVSSWWMISTYFGGSSGNLDAGNDFFKILSFTGNVCQYSSTTNGGLCTNGGPGPAAVPEPTSLALVSIALAGVAGVRRRRNLLVRG